MTTLPEGFVPQAEVDSEHTVCPHCETWMLSECLNGHGCPTRDGRNGETYRRPTQQEAKP